MTKAFQTFATVASIGPDHAVDMVERAYISHTSLEGDDEHYVMVLTD